MVNPVRGVLSLYRRLFKRSLGLHTDSLGHIKQETVKKRQHLREIDETVQRIETLAAAFEDIIYAQMGSNSFKADKCEKAR